MHPHLGLTLQNSETGANLTASSESFSTHILKVLDVANTDYSEINIGMIYSFNKFLSLFAPISLQPYMSVLRYSM